MKKPYFLFLMFIVLLACDDYCAETIRSTFNSKDIDWFEIQEGDIHYFRDTTSSDTLYLNCKLRQLGYDTLYETNSRCNAGFNYDYLGMYGLHFNSNIHHGGSGFVNLHFHVQKVSSRMQRIYLIFKESEEIDGWTRIYNGSFAMGESYFYIFFYNPQTDSVWEDNYGSKLSIKKDILIGEENFEEVYVLSDPRHDTPHTIIHYYDTLYINKEGLLKLVSSARNKVLERIPKED